MENPNLEALAAAASEYDRFLVPVLLQPWAPLVAEAARLRPGQRVLDVACGTGVLTREAAARVGAGGSVAGLDRNPGMLTVARQRSPEIAWQEGIAESLPFADASFDAVVSQFGLMFFADRLQAVREMRRVLRPGGRLAVAVWDRVESAPAYAAEVVLVERLAGPEAAEPLLSPFALGNPEDLAGLFTAAGVAEAAVATQRGAATFPSIEAMVGVDLRGWLPANGVVLTEPKIREILREAEHVLSGYVTPNGVVTFDISAHIVTGMAPGL